jgi:hypothetical protein
MDINTYNSSGTFYGKLRIFCFQVLGVTEVPTEKELLEIWEDLLFNAHFGCMPSQSQSHGIYLEFPSSIWTHKENIVFENLLEVFNRNVIKYPDEAQQFSPLLFVRLEEQLAPPLLPALLGGTETASNWLKQLTLSLTEFHQYFGKCDHAGYNSELLSLDLMRSKKLITLSGVPNQDWTMHMTRTIPPESFIYLSHRADCSCLGRDSFGEIRNSLTYYCSRALDCLRGIPPIVESSDIHSALIRSAGHHVVGFGSKR